MTTLEEIEFLRKELKRVSPNYEAEEAKKYWAQIRKTEYFEPPEATQPKDILACDLYC